MIRLRASLAPLETTLTDLRFRLLVTAGIAVVIAIAVSSLLARSTAEPLRRMSDAARRIAGGDYGARPNVTTPDEFGELGRSLSELASRLEADMAQIKKLEELRREFVANVSHELRTPVTAIQGYAETLLEGGADPETARRFLTTPRSKRRRRAKPWPSGAAACAKVYSTQRGA